jgi:YT521-B-like domain
VLFGIPYYIDGNTAQREIKVSRDGTEIEPGVGQRLLEEWERTDTGPIAGRAALSPTSLRIPPSLTQAFIPRGRGRGRGAMTGGWAQRDTGQ